jgi:hypothetical protein
LQAFLHGTYVASYKSVLARSIIPTFTINIDSQSYKASGAFFDDQWVSLPVAFALVLAGSPATSKVWLNILAESNPMHLFANDTASSHNTTIHHFGKCLQEQGSSKNSGMAKMLQQTWAGQIWGVKTLDLPPNMINKVPPTIVLVLVERVLQNFAGNLQKDTMHVLTAEQAHPGTETVFLSGCALLCLNSYFSSS